MASGSKSPSSGMARLPSPTPATTSAKPISRGSRLETANGRLASTPAQAQAAFAAREFSGMRRHSDSGAGTPSKSRRNVSRLARRRMASASTAKVMESLRVDGEGSPWLPARDPTGSAGRGPAQYHRPRPARLERHAGRRQRRPEKLAMSHRPNLTHEIFSFFLGTPLV